MKEIHQHLIFQENHILLVEDNELNAEIGIELLNTFKVIIDLAKMEKNV